MFGYRSQPTSNRSSIHLTGLSTTERESYGSRGSSRVNLNADLDRQLKRLVERTEKFSNRVERLQNTSNYLSRGLGSSGESSRKIFSSFIDVVTSTSVLKIKTFIRSLDEGQGFLSTRFLA